MLGARRRAQDGSARYAPAPRATRRRALLAGLLLVLFGCAAWAQSSRVSGAMQGVVVDETGAAVPGAAISLTEQESGWQRTAVSGDDGRFLLQGLPSGEYRVRVEQEGFAAAVIGGVVISLGATTSERIELKPATVTESIEVEAQAGAVETSATSASAALGSERIEEGPSSNRNFLNFVLVAPGVAASNGSNAQRSLTGLRSAMPDSGFAFGGMRGRNNSLSIDGVDNRDETTGGNRVAVGVEMVREFRVAGAILGAEFGGAAGGAVNVVTRSGNNQWHGDFTWFFQNEAVNARDPEVTAGRAPKLRKYQPGFSVMGPLRRDRTFFAMALEQEWETGEEWSDTAAAWGSSIDRVLQSPAYARSGVHSVTEGLFPTASSETEYSFKLDHQFSPSQTFTARYAFSRGRVDDEVQGLDNFADRSSRGSSYVRDHSLVAALTSVPRPNLVNDLRFQYGRRDMSLQPNSPGAMLEVPGLITLGQAYTLDAGRAEQHWEAVEGVNVVLGAHQLGFGGSLHQISLDARLANRFAGVFVFPTLDDLLQARPDVFLQAFGEAPTRYSTTPAGLWFQERWQPWQRLTLEAGLRWDAQSLPAPFAGPRANLAPRLGLAWVPFGDRSSQRPFLIRAGLGWFYDRYPLAFLNDAIQKDGVRGFEQYLVGDAAVRALQAGAGGPLAAPLPGEPTAVYRRDPNFPSTYSRKVTVGVEKGLNKETRLTVEYAAVRGYHLPRVRNVAGGLPPSYQLEQTSRSSYHGVTVSVERKLVRDVSFLVAYGYSRTWDDASDFDEQPLDPFNLSLDWALSRQHQAQRFVASGLFELPADDWGWAPPWLREGFDDVIVSPIFTAGSGRPVNALSSTDVFRTGAFPISARPPGVARNPFLSPGTVNVDLRIMKGFWVKEGRAIVQAGIEAFNLLNHSNALRVSPYYAGAVSLPSYGEPLETLGARRIQMMVQFEY
jgi:Carboxypeptidase regulatory-like domain